MWVGGEVSLQLHPRDVSTKSGACLFFLASLACFVHARDSATGKQWFRYQIWRRMALEITPGWVGVSSASKVQVA